MSVELEDYDAVAGARDLEAEYKWREAAGRYKEVLDTPQDGPARTAELDDLRGYALYRCAMQAETKDDFQLQIREAVSCYEDVKRLLDKERTGRRTGQVARADAWITYLQYWLAPQQAEKRRLLEKTWRFVREALERSKASGDWLGFSKTYLDLGRIPGLRIWFEWNSKTREQIVREVLALGHEAIELLSDKSASQALAAAYARAAGSMFFLADSFDPEIVDEIRRYVKTGREYWSRAQNLSAEQTFVEMLGNPLVNPFSEDTSVDAQVKLEEEALSYACKSRDKLMIGSAHDWLTQETTLKSLIVEDSKEATSLCNKALQHARAAEEQYSTLSFVSPRGGVLWVRAPLAEYYAIVSLYEPYPDRKRKLLEKSADELTDLLEQSRTAAYPDIVWDAHHVASKTLLWLSRTQMDRKDREKMLRESLRYRFESMRISKRLQSNIAAGLRECLDLSYLADLECELSETYAASSPSKKRLLEAAARDKGKALRALVKYDDILPGESESDYYRRIRARSLNEYGDLLNRLFTMSGKEGDLRTAASSYKDASNIFESLGQPSRAAECRWKASAASSELGEFETASDGFMIASKEYTAAAAKFPELEKFYQDYSIYMQAWSEIERARTHHSVEKYPEATVHYQAASRLLEKTTQWKYLAPSYAALYHMENGEDLSRRDLLEGATQQFETAERLFQETCLQVQTSFADTKIAEEKQVVAEVTKIAKLRAEYSKARKYMEEGKILGKKGDNHASAERYRLAVEALQRISKPRFSENLQADVKYGLSLAKALQAEAQAETKGSYALYRKTSALFEQASHLASTEGSRAFLLGHARFCEALGFGQRFLSNQSISSHNRATQLLENAVQYYLKAGFHNASEHAKATRRLFDACVYLNRAGDENDEGKRANLYVAAEKLLKVAVEIYGEIGRTATKDQALRLLESAREEKEIALSLRGVFQPQPLQSPMTPAMLSGERPIGVEKFQGAYVQANLASSPQNPQLGEPLSLRIELANAGGAPARLIMVERAIPEGFEIVNKPGELPIEGNRLILNGRLLDPLKTQKLELVLKPKVDGPFALRPRLSYIDEKGNNKFHEPTPLEIIVSAGGNTAEIAHAPVPASSPMLGFLLESFVEDYMRKRLPVEQSGWRCLNEIVSSLQIPKSQVYGDSRYGHSFAKPLEKVVRSGIVEFRVFPGERGRGGNVIKVRMNYEKEPVKRLVDTFALKAVG